MKKLTFISFAALSLLGLILVGNYVLLKSETQSKHISDALSDSDHAKANEKSVEVKSGHASNRLESGHVSNLVTKINKAHEADSTTFENRRNEAHLDNSSKYSYKYILDKESIQQDELGNQIAEMYLDAEDATQLFVITSEPIKFMGDNGHPHSNSDLTGCSLGDFYISYQEEITVVHHKDNVPIIRSYLCEYDDLSAYYLEDAVEAPVTQVQGAKDIQMLMGL